MPLVSIVIPTFKRPESLTTAIRSVLAQTFTDFEVIVVADAGEPTSAAAARAIDDARVRALMPDTQLGNAEARNVGIRAAAGRWVALLDDDDWWAPEKLEHQLPVAEAAEGDVIVSCRFEARGARSALTWPRRLPNEGEPVCEYVFCRHRSPGVEGAVQTSTFLTSRDLLLRVPFDRELARLVDLDWLLRAVDQGAALVFPPTDQILSTYATGDAQPRVTHTARWAWELEWARERRSLLTDRAYAGFLLTSASLAAARGGDRRAYLPLLREAVMRGRASPAEIAFHTANTVLPEAAKRRAAAWIERRARQAG